MKTMHIHVGVDDIVQGIKFYSALFGVEPVKQQSDYAKWMLDDPLINFAISTRVQTAGVDHLGIQVECAEELASMRERIKQADISVYNEGETVCCYARSDKSWVQDPGGIAWETYLSMEDVAVFSEKQDADKAETADQKVGCC